MKILNVMLLCAGMAEAQDSTPLTLRTIIPLSDVNGRMDHFSADLTGRRVFFSGLENHTVEVLNAATFTRLQTIPNIAEPQGLLYLSASNRLFVASAADGTARIFDGATYTQIAAVTLGDDADNIRYDSTRGRIVVGYGSGALAMLAPDGTKKSEIRLDAHPESFQLEKEGNRAFVNVPGRLEIEVVDLSKGSVLAKWHEWTSLRNFPMSLDEKHQRLFVGFRTPAKLLELDSQTGKTIASAEIVGDTDDLFYDAVRNRVYVIGGSGFVDVLDVTGVRMRRIAHIQTSEGSRTGLFVPEWNRLFVASPRRGDRSAAIRVYDVSDGK